MILKLNAPLKGNETIVAADVGQIDLTTQTVAWSWADADGKPVSGTSGTGVATYSAAGPIPTEAELVAAIEATTV